MPGIGLVVDEGREEGVRDGMWRDGEWRDERRAEGVGDTRAREHIIIDKRRVEDMRDETNCCGLHHSRMRAEWREESDRHRR